MNAQPDTAPKDYRYYHAVAMIFVATLLISNTIAGKVITCWGFTLPAGIITFPIAYLAGDVLTEIYGFRKTRSIIWWGFICLASMSLFYWLATLLTPAPFWTEENVAFVKFFGFVPRIALASLIAYLVGEFLNSIVLSKMKVKTGGRHFWLRAMTSTIVGQGADSFLFNFIAFEGIFPISTVAYIAFSGFVLKSLYEGVMLFPVTTPLVKWLKKAENVDTTDHGVDYTLLKLN